MEADVPQQHRLIITYGTNVLRVQMASGLGRHGICHSAEYEQLIICCCWHVGCSDYFFIITAGTMTTDPGLGRKSYVAILLESAWTIIPSAWLEE